MKKDFAFCPKAKREPELGARCEASGDGISGAFGVGGGGGGVCGERRASCFETQARPSRQNVYLHVPPAVSHRGKNAAPGGAEIHRPSRERSEATCASRDSRNAIRVRETGYQTHAGKFVAGFRKAAAGFGKDSCIACADSHCRRRTFSRGSFVGCKTLRHRNDGNEGARASRVRARIAARAACCAPASRHRTWETVRFAVVAG